MILLYIFVLVLCIYLLKSREGYRGGRGGNKRDRWGKGPYGNPIPPGRKGWRPYSNYWGGYGYGQGYYPVGGYPLIYGPTCPLRDGCPVPVNPAPLPGYFGEYGVYGVPTSPYYNPYPCSAGVCYN